MKIVSIDIETTGLDPNTCQILEFACVLEDTQEFREIPVSQLPSYTTIVNQPFITGQPFALNLNKRIIQILSDYNNKNVGADPEFNIIEPDQLLHNFLQFLVTNHIHLTEKVNIIGKNYLGFDKGFLDKLDFSNSFKWYRRVLDPAMLFHDPAVDYHLPDTLTCLQRAGLTTEGLHEALTDARNMIKLYRIGKGYTRVL